MEVKRRSPSGKLAGEFSSVLWLLKTSDVTKTMSDPYQPPSAETDSDLRTAIASPTRVLQGITFALAQGAIVLWGIFLFLGEGAVDGEPDVVSWIAAGIAGLMFVMHLVLPAIIQNGALNGLKNDRYRDLPFEEKVQRVFATFQTRQVITCAMLEGGAIFNGIAYLLKPWVGSVIAGAVMIVLMLTKMPLPTSLSFKVQDRMRVLEM